MHRITLSVALGLGLTFVPALAGPCGRCSADFDDGTRTGTLDGGVTIDDLLYFLQLFEEGDVRVCEWYHCLEPGGCVKAGIDPLLAFLYLYEQGC